MPSTSDEPVIGALAEVWSSIEAACADLDAAAWDRPTECPGWSVRDQVAHLIGTERFLLGDAEVEPLDSVPDYVHNPIGEANEAWVVSRRARPGDEVLAEFHDVTGRRLAQMAEMPTERFDEVGWSPAGQVPYREFMSVRAFDCFVHEQDIRRALDRPGGRGGSGESVTLDRVAMAMGFVVGRKVGPPEGTTVVFEVTGPDPRTLALVIEHGRAVAPAELAGRPDRPPDPRGAGVLAARLRPGRGRRGPGRGRGAARRRRRARPAGARRHALHDLS